jgi:DNA-binding IclR family transcriptional regulator
MANSERRNLRERGAKVQRLVQGVIQNPSVTLSVDTLCEWLGVPPGAAHRILNNLISSGLVREAGRGVFVPCISTPSFCIYR